MNHVKYTMKSSIKYFVKVGTVPNLWVVRLGHVKLSEVRSLEELREWRTE